jgi:4-amino-4-deoxy-L-arabinose transferase-like glycosyltransferase
MLQRALPGVLLISSSRPSAPRRPVVLLIVVALAPLWLTGIFGRALWTPDEPREADIAWRMSLQSQHAIPQLAGVPFLEKPPLSYWMSAAALRVWGDRPGALRAPNLLYAVIAAAAIGALTLAMVNDTLAALLAALVAGSALTAWRSFIWLAPDSCLLAGCALALLGAWQGYTGARGARKAFGYALMHVGAALGFMAKSAPGLLVPALALLALIVWERRWRELACWELYAGFALEALIIGPWLLAVAHSPHGGEALRTLFWNNLAGRFTHVSGPAALDYTTGHHNFPGKYLLELPVYLLPWTLLVLAGLVRALRGVRLPAPQGTPWRFALCASLPFLLLLSLATTARDIYAAPALLGLALLCGVWVHALPQQTRPLDRAALLLTPVLMALVLGALAVALLVMALAGASAALPTVSAALVVAALALWQLAASARARRRGVPAQSLLLAYAGYASAVAVAAWVALPMVDRWQDLPALAARIHGDTLRAPLALLDPDETTIAMLDRGVAAPMTLLTGSEPPQARVRAWFAHAGNSARLLVLLPGHAPGPLSMWLARWQARPAPGDGIAATLVDAHAARVLKRYELPQGRRYALLEPPADNLP